MLDQLKVIEIGKGLGQLAGSMQRVGNDKIARIIEESAGEGTRLRDLLRQSLSNLHTYLGNEEAKKNSINLVETFHDLFRSLNALIVDPKVSEREDAKHGRGLFGRRSEGLAKSSRPCLAFSSDEVFA